MWAGGPEPQRRQSQRLSGLAEGRQPGPPLGQKLGLRPRPPPQATEESSGYGGISDVVS